MKLVKEAIKMIYKTIAVFLIIYIAYTHGRCPNMNFVNKHVKMTRVNTADNAAKGAKEGERHGYVHSNTNTTNIASFSSNT